MVAGRDIIKGWVILEREERVDGAGSSNATGVRVFSLQPGERVPRYLRPAPCSPGAALCTWQGCSLAMVVSTNRRIPERRTQPRLLSA